MENVQTDKKSFFLIPHRTRPMPVDQRFLAQDFPAIGAAGQTIQIRVEWRGDGDRLGTFQVDTNGHANGAGWVGCPNIAAGMPANDFIFPLESIPGDVPLHLERGPDHAERPFKVRAIPITWLQRKPQDVDAERVVIRGQDYDYQSTPEEPVWRESTLINGVQTVDLTLPRGTDYEIWTQLQHPTDDDQWLPQDPVVDGGGSDWERSAAAQ